MADHDGIDLQSEVNRLLTALKFEDIRKDGIKILPEEQYNKAKVGFQNDAQRKIYRPINELGWIAFWKLLKEKEEGITNLCGYASYYLAEQWDYDTLENKELLLNFPGTIVLSGDIRCLKGH